MSVGTLVLIEQLDGAVADVSYEVLGLGRLLAEALQTPLCALALGQGVAALTAKLGICDRVIISEAHGSGLPDADTVVAALEQVIKQEQVGLVLLGGTNVSLGLGSKLAARTGLPFVNFCRRLRVDQSAVVLTCQLFGGKVLADVRLPDGRGIISVCPGSAPLEAGKREGAPAVETLPWPTLEPKVGFRRFLEPAAGDIDITKMDVLVSVGRGIQNADNLQVAEELAKALGGAVSSSRPVVDQGWLPLTRQVGKSGMTVKPKLYLALGISGAPEHQEGMKDAPLIIAVNTDPKAPIFDIAHYGAEMDLFDLVEPLKQAVEKKRHKT
jgi:electron transfer flavoprotein alpha subunit